MVNNPPHDHPAKDMTPADMQNLLDEILPPSKSITPTREASPPAVNTAEVADTQPSSAIPQTYVVGSRGNAQRGDQFDQDAKAGRAEAIKKARESQDQSPQR